MIWMKFYNNDNDKNEKPKSKRPKWQRRLNNKNLFGKYALAVFCHV